MYAEAYSRTSRCSSQDIPAVRRRDGADQRHRMAVVAKQLMQPLRALRVNPVRSGSRPGREPGRVRSSPRTEQSAKVLSRICLNWRLVFAKGDTLMKKHA